MKDKKHMVIAGVAVLAVVLVAGVAVMHGKTGRSMDSDSDLLSSELKNGIDYGGTFDEFQSMHEEDELETSDSDEMVAEEIKKLKKSRTGDVFKGENLTKDTPVKVDTVSYENNEEQENVEEVSDTVENELELTDMTAHRSSGYAEHEVLCDAQSEGEAEEIANQISGTLLSWKYGTATIQITDSVDEFLERYEQQGGDIKLYRKYYF